MPDDSRLIAFLSWILFLVGAIIAILLRPYDRYVIYHAKQSIVFSLVMIIVHVVLSSFSYMGFIFFGWVFWILDRLFLVFMVAIAVVTAIRAWEGQWVRIPFVYDIAIQF